MLLKAYFVQLPKKSKFYNVRLKHLACRMTKPETVQLKSPHTVNLFP